MSDFDFSFNVDDVPVSDSYQPLEPGVYELCAVEASIKPNKAGTGQVTTVKFQVLSQSGKGRTITEFFNLQHANEKTQAIARESFRNFMLSIGKKTIHSINEILNLPFQAKLGVRESEYNGETRLYNTIKSYIANPAMKGNAQTVGSLTQKPASSVSQQSPAAIQTPW